MNEENLTSRRAAAWILSGESRNESNYVLGIMYRDYVMHSDIGSTAKQRVGVRVIG